MSKVVVFGGSGFLGSHVADALSSEGHQVHIFDLKPSAYLKPGQEMCVGDILDKPSVYKACEGATYVYNFAGLADIGEGFGDPETTILKNILGNQTILEAARRAGAKRYIYASTVYVYGESGGFYRASKQAAEGYVELYWDQFGLPFTILRYGSLYGRRADRRNAIHQFIASALQKSAIEYSGNGDELREYIHVEDAATASVRVLSPEYENRHVVLTGHQAMRVKDVMTMIAEIFQNRVALKFNEGRNAGHYCITPYSFKPRIGKKLVVNPFVDMGQGILDCIHEQVETRGPSGESEVELLSN